MNLDFNFLKESYIYFLDGAKWTLIISLISVFIGTLFGTLLCFMKRSKFKIFKIISTVYVEIVRGTPLLLQIMIVYIGSSAVFDIDIDVLPAAIIAIALNSGAYVSELIRAGIDAVDKGQLEAARSLGMTEGKAMILIILPQAIRKILPAVGNEFVAVIKESSMASTIGVAELMYGANVVTGVTYKAFEPLIVAAVFYFIMTFSLGRLMSYIERKLSIDDKSTELA
ncbi:amino acid ABC transporter permease [Clostridium tarantellae]|uniref:ABC transporter permease subunit n=1 Tax=Clostridium tarantellae TaxID=39493 RepID=A0A6I1MGU9_9CLOT|nr:amino acid ABC transporter permease [Clostridium tarantellae]MPQ42595.1 ABC transporter permease subunit [Clostridium tarantellae]